MPESNPTETASMRDSENSIAMHLQDCGDDSEQSVETISSLSVSEEAPVTILNESERKKLKDKLMESAETASKWITEFENNQAYIRRVKENLPFGIDDVKQNIIRIRDREKKRLEREIKKIEQAADAKLKLFEETRSSRLNELEMYTTENMKEFYEVRDALKAASDVEGKLISQPSDTIVEKALKTLKELKKSLKTSVNFDEFKRGDSVRKTFSHDGLIKTVDNLLEEIDLNVIGRVIEIHPSLNKGGVLFPGKTTYQLCDPGELSLSLTRAKVPYISDTVKFAKKPIRKDDKVTQEYMNALKWYQNKSEGIIIKLNHDPIKMECEDVTVVFNGRVWKGQYSQLKLAANGIIEGTEVMLNRSLIDTDEDLQGVTRSSVGVLKTTSYNDNAGVVVDFPECHAWKGKGSDVEVFRYATLKDYVKPKLGTDLTQSEWVGLSHDEPGQVLEIYYAQPRAGTEEIEGECSQRAKVRFHSKGVDCPVEELDVIEKPTGGEINFDWNIRKQALSVFRGANKPNLDSPLDPVSSFNSA